MTGVISTGSHPKDLWPGVAAFFGAKYDEHPTEYTSLFEVKTSRQAWEEYVHYTGFGLVPVKPEGSNVTYASHNQQYTSRFTNVAYGMGYVVTREELDDNLYESVSTGRAESLAFSLRQTEENVGANVFNRAFDSNYTGGDSVELLSPSHTSPAGNWSNHLTTAADMSEASVEDLAVQMMDATDAKGLKVSLRPTCLVIPTALTFEAERIFKSQLQSGTANNDVNALRTHGTIPKIVVNHYLTDPDAWFIKSNAPKGLVWWDRQTMEFTKDQEFDSENAKAKVFRRFVPGWGDPRTLWGSPGA